MIYEAEMQEMKADEGQTNEKDKGVERDSKE
jgi:hypothetical protein